MLAKPLLKSWDLLKFSNFGRILSRGRIRSLGRICGLFGVRCLTACCLFGFVVNPQDQLKQQINWPDRYSGSYGFEIIADHNGTIIVSSVDTTHQAYKLGIRPGMALLGWNQLTVDRKVESIKVRKYRRIFPVMTDQNIKLMLLTRGRPGDSAEVFFMTATGNNRGVRLTASR